MDAILSMRVPLTLPSNQICENRRCVLACDTEARGVEVSYADRDQELEIRLAASLLPLDIAGLEDADPRTASSMQELLDMLPAMRRRAGAHAETAMCHIEIVDDFGFSELRAEMECGLAEVLDMYDMIDELESTIHKRLRRWPKRLRKFAATHVHARRFSQSFSARI